MQINELGDLRTENEIERFQLRIAQRLLQVGILCSGNIIQGMDQVSKRTPSLHHANKFNRAVIANATPTNLLKPE